MKIKLLIVEDNEDDYELTREFLSTKKVNISWTQNLNDTIDALRSEEFDVILLDLGVSDSQGLSTFDGIVNCVSTPPAIIVFTGTDDDELAQEAIARGAQDYLVKGSVTPELLMRSMKYAIERHKIEQQLRKSNDDLVAMNTQLMQARDLAYEASRLKSEFLANLSHEVRTPLSGIVGLSQLLMDETDPANIKEFQQAIRECSTLLMQIVSDMLDLSKLEAGLMTVNNVHCDIRSVVHDVLSPIEPTAKLKNISLVTEITEAVPDAIVVDELRLKQIILNLLHNAVKFTEKGSVEVKVSYNSAPHSLLKVAVLDTGIGISPQAKNSIFEPFVQADGSTSRLYGGTGLGLAISKKSAELMGGQIGVESEVGKGALFWLEVPVRVA